MRLLVFGATGGTGKELVSQALAAGHEVLAIVRNASGVSTQHERLRVIQGNIFEPTTYASELNGADAVVGALGAHGVPKSPVSLYSDWASHILPAMRERGVSRIIAVSAGAYVNSARSPALFRLIVQPILLRLLRHTYDDLQRMEALIADSSTRWTIVRPGRLTDGPLTGEYRTAINDVVAGGWTIARADVADLILKCAVTGAHVGERLSITR